MRNVALAFLSLLLLNCSYFHKPETDQKRYEYQEDAGSILVGVQSVAPFEAYIDALQPRFNLTAEDALKTAVATTQIQELKELRALLLSVALNLPTKTGSVNEQVARTGEQTTSSRTETNTGATGAVPAAAVPSKLTDVISQLGDPSTSVSLDASLNYRAAAALMQEVALLSNYVRDAAVGGHTTPYVVRMLLTVFPSSRRSPYDVYTNISFFGSKGSEAARSAGPLVFNKGIYIPSIARDVIADEIATCNGEPLQVIPLFVTDNLETSVLRASRGSAADLGGSVGGTIGAAGIGIGGRTQNESSTSTLGKGINALFTLGVASKNTLAVRLGAVGYDTGYEMLPRTYNLTALVLLPSISIRDVFNAKIERKANLVQTEEDRLMSDLLSKLQRSGVTENDILLPCTSVNFRAQSKLRDAVTGKLLASPNPRALGDDLLALGLGVDSELMSAILSDDYNAFKRVYDARAPQAFGVGGAEKYGEYLWNEAVTIRTHQGLASGQFEVPRTLVQFFAQDVTKKIAIYDDGKTASVQLSGGLGITSKGLSGKLTATAKTGNKSWTVYSTNAMSTNDGTGARIDFPSIQQAAKAANVDIKDVETEIAIEYAPPVQRWSPDRNTYLVWGQTQSPIVTTDSKVIPVAFSLAPNSSYLRAGADGVGQVRIEIRATDKAIPVPEIRFSIDGGVVTNISPAAEAGAGADIILLTEKSYIVTIGGLLPGNTLKLKAWRMDGSTKIELPATPLAVYEGESTPAKK